MGSAVSWALGDWLVYGEGRGDWGEKYTQAMSETGKSYESLVNFMVVSKAFELKRRRFNLSHSHHREIGALDPAAADLILNATPWPWSRCRCLTPPPRPDADGVSTRCGRRAAQRLRAGQPLAGASPASMCLYSAYRKEPGSLDFSNDPGLIGRDDWIRTSDPLTPSQVRYQTAPHPDATLIFDSKWLS